MSALKGYFALVLHSHMPYVRKNGIWPVGEDWIYQVMSDTYLPLLETLKRLEERGLDKCLSVTLTPVLTEQLRDTHIREGFARYLDTMAERAAVDARDFVYFGDRARKSLADAYIEGFRSRKSAFHEIDGDITGTFRALEERGTIEILASCATHAFLPGQPDRRAVENQIVTGIESHRRVFGRNPAGFWLPECAYLKGVESILEREGVRYTLVDPTALQGKDGLRPYLTGGSGVVVLARSERAHRDVWDEQHGYPTCGSYLDMTRYYENSGLHYWRVTGRDVPIEEKEVYEPGVAKAAASGHAGHFAGRVEEELEATPPSTPRPIVLASFDTELFGHGWSEGFLWMEKTLEILWSLGDVEVTTPGVYLGLEKPNERAELSETTWGTGRDHSTWINRDTTWMWESLKEAQERFYRLLERLSDTCDQLTARALLQAARELMLLESSDWPYMVAKDRARQYATQRFDAHLERFNAILEAFEGGGTESLDARLSEIEDADNIFATLNLNILGGGGSPWRSEGSQGCGC